MCVCPSNKEEKSRVDLKREENGEVEEIRVQTPSISVSWSEEESDVRSSLCGKRRSQNSNSPFEPVSTKRKNIQKIQSFRSLRGNSCNTMDFKSFN